jgi:hypothetical protein
MDGCAFLKLPFTPGELRILHSLNTPVKIQRWIEALPYHHGRTAWSPRRVLREQTADCLEGAIFAAAALRVHGFPPLIWDLEAVHDDDHVLAIFKIEGHWGAIAKSNYAGLRYREPVYRSLRELAMSYFNDYFNLRGERTLRAFSQPVNLARFDQRNWMTAEEDLWYIPEHLVELPHKSLFPARVANRLTRLDARAQAAGKTGRQEKRRSR